jgi:hypothetical protein
MKNIPFMALPSGELSQDEEREPITSAMRKALEQSLSIS